MATLLIETLVNMNMISMAMAFEKDRDDKRYHYDSNNRYQQSTYELDTYTSNYGMSSSSDGRYDIASYDQQRDNNSYDKIPYKLLRQILNTQRKIKM